MIPLAAIPVVTFDFEADDGAAVESGDTRQWAWGEPATGPVAGQGTCWATVLGGDYLLDSTDEITLALPDLGGVARPVLEVVHARAIAAGDGGAVELDAGAGFAPLLPYGGYPDPEGFSGTTAGYAPTWFALPPLGAGARVRLVFRSDAAGTDDGWFVRSVSVLDGDAAPPEIAVLEAPTDTQDLAGPYRVALAVSDETALARVSFSASLDGGPPDTLALEAPYVAEIPGVDPGTTVTWWVEATDGENAARWPPEGAASFRVFLAAPTGLRADLPPRPVAQVAPLSWTPPDSPHPVLRYEVVDAGGTVVGESTAPALDVALAPSGPRVFAVRAVFDAAGGAAGDLSAALELDDVAVPSAALSPERVWRGEDVFVAIRGTSLVLRDGVPVDFGPGIDVVALEVRDVDSAIATLHVGADAPIGVGTLTVDGFRFPGLTVGAAEDAPRLVSFAPDALTQAEEIAVVAVASEPFRGPVTVEVPEGLVVTSDVAISGTEARFSLAAGGAAALGAYPVLLRDDQRLWSAEVTVGGRKLVGDRCACEAGGGALGWGGLALAFSATRRRRAR